MDISASVLADGEMSESFCVGVGVRQVCDVIMACQYIHGWLYVTYESQIRRFWCTAGNKRYGAVHGGRLICR